MESQGGVAMIGKIVWAIKKFHFRCQRFRRGWADSDLWNIDLWFIKTFEPMLRQFAQTSYSLPARYTMEEWVSRINTMADALHFMLEDNVVEEKLGGWDNYDYNRVSEILLENKNKFFELFSEDFWSLWN